MTVVAVTGVSGAVGTALLRRLAGEEAVEWIVGVDVLEPDMPLAKLDFRVADVRDPVLSHALVGADVVVHLAGWVTGTPQDTHFSRVVHGTRNLLAAVERVGAEAVVHLSTAMVYGAHPSNAMPLTEDAPLRANHDAWEAYHQLLAEELLAEFAEGHPATRVAVLRPAAVLGTEVPEPSTRLAAGLSPVSVAGHEPTRQLLDVDDLGAALHLAVVGDLAGAYNVAPDGWVTAGEVAALLGRRQLRLPPGWLTAALPLLRRAGISQMTEGHLAYAMHPWVVDSSRLRAAGWQAQRSHRDILRTFPAGHYSVLRLGMLRVRRHGALGGVVAVATLAVAWAWRRRRRRVARTTRRP